MKKQKDEVVFEIINLPIKILEEDISVNEALRRTGYCLYCEEIHEIDIFDVLQKDPSKASFWMEYSENKRVSGGFYFFAIHNAFRVGSYSSISGDSYILYKDEMKACASFIKQELDLICSNQNIIQKNSKNQ